jgi:hypothetical protein
MCRFGMQLRIYIYIYIYIYIERERERDFLKIIIKKKNSWKQNKHKTSFSSFLAHKKQRNNSSLSLSLAFSSSFEMISLSHSRT